MSDAIIVNVASETEYADVAHLVERHLAKVEVASSSLVVRSKEVTFVEQKLLFFIQAAGLAYHQPLGLYIEFLPPAAPRWSFVFYGFIKCLQVFPNCLLTFPDL